MRNFRTRWAAGIIGAAMGMSLLVPFAASAETMVPSGTKVPLEFTQRISTKTAKKGDTVELRVTEDVRVDGRTMIPEGAPAEGVITDVHRGRTFGRKGELKIRLTHVRDRNGDRIPIERYHSGDRFSAGGPAAAGAGLLVLGPVGLAAGALVHGSDFTIKEGTRIEAEVAGPHD